MQPHRVVSALDEAEAGHSCFSPGREPAPVGLLAFEGCEEALAHRVAVGASIEDEAIIVAFRRHTLLPLDDCLDALQATIPHLPRSSLHRCLQRHGIGGLPDVDGDKPTKRTFKTYPLGFLHIDIAEVQTAEGKLYLFVAIDRTSKFAFVSPSPTKSTPS